MEVKTQTIAHRAGKQLFVTKIEQYHRACIHAR